jgi:hypothetical protein
MVTLVTVLAAFGAFCLILLGFLGEREPWALHAEEGPLTRLEKRKLQLLRAMQALDAEHSTEGEADESYSIARSDLKRKAVDLARRIEEARSARLRSLFRPRSGPATEDRLRIERLVGLRASPRDPPPGTQSLPTTPPSGEGALS